MNQWTIVHEYQNIVKQNEKIISIATSETNSNLIGIILEEKRCWHFELRNRSMLLISLIQLDKSEYSRQLISLPNSNMNWLIVHASSKLFTIISENGQTKQMIECAENMELATYIPKNNCLVVLTEKDKLKFFDL
jgi:hypothetical protein